MYFTKPTKKVPSYAYVMLAITLAYLTVEVPFSVHLIEFMGGNPSIADIDAIEVFGRVLTGFAVAIFILGAFVLPRLTFQNKLLRLAVIVMAAAASVGSTFVVLNSVADYLGTSSSPEQRREAFRTNVVKRQIAQNGIGDITATNSNDWLTFVSAIPSLSANTDQLMQIANVEQNGMITQEGYRALGAVEVARDVFFQLRDEIGLTLFKEFQQAFPDRERLEADARTAANRAMSDFNAYAQKTVFAWYWVDKAGKAKAAREAYKKHGLVFTDRQDPNNFDVFFPVFRAKYMEKAHGQVNKSIKEKFGVTIDPDISFASFLSLPAVNKEIRSSLSLPVSTIAINKDMSAADFSTHVYEPMAQNNKKLFERAFVAPAAKFADGEEFADLGINAVKMTSVPVMAILLSIAGAMLHIYKFSAYLIQVLVGRLKRPVIGGFARHVLGAAVMAIAFIGMGISGNSVTANEAFVQMKASTPVAVLMHGAIAIQPEFSRLGRGLGSIGPWNLIEPHLPAPVLFTVSISDQSAKSPSFKVILPSAEKIPVPTFRPVK